MHQLSEGILFLFTLHQSVEVCCCACDIFLLYLSRRVLERIVIRPRAFYSIVFIEDVLSSWAEVLVKLHLVGCHFLLQLLYRYVPSWVVLDNLSNRILPVYHFWIFRSFSLVFTFGEIKCNLLDCVPSHKIGEGPIIERTLAPLRNVGPSLISYLAPELCWRFSMSLGKCW